MLAKSTLRVYILDFESVKCNKSCSHVGMGYLIERFHLVYNTSTTLYFETFSAKAEIFEYWFIDSQKSVDQLL